MKKTPTSLAIVLADASAGPHAGAYFLMPTADFRFGEAYQEVARVETHKKGIATDATGTRWQIFPDWSARKAS